MNKRDVVFAVLIVILVTAIIVFIAGYEEANVFVKNVDENGSEVISEPSVFNEGEILKELDKIAEKYPYILSIEPGKGGAYEEINIHIASYKWKESEPQVKMSIRRVLTDRIYKVITKSGYPTSSVKINIIVEAY